MSDIDQAGALITEAIGTLSEGHWTSLTDEEQEYFFMALASLERVKKSEV